MPVIPGLKFKLNIGLTFQVKINQRANDQTRILRKKPPVLPQNVNAHEPEHGRNIGDAQSQNQPCQPQIRGTLFRDAPSAELVHIKKPLQEGKEQDKGVYIQLEIHVVAALRVLSLAIDKTRSCNKGLETT